MTLRPDELTVLVATRRVPSTVSGYLTRELGEDRERWRLLDTLAASHQGTLVELVDLVTDLDGADAP